MKILILHQHYKTPHGGGAIRSYYLARALSDAGHQVAIITAGQDSHVVDHSEGLEVHYLHVPYDNRFRFYRRAWAFFMFAFKVARYSVRFRDYQFCYAISVPLTVGLAARWLKQRYGIPYIFEVGDLWPDAPIQLGFLRNPVLKRWALSMEKSIYRHADSIVALSPAIADAVRKKSPGKHVHMIPNMADCEYFSPAESRHTSARFTVSYIGAMGMANGLEFILACARESQTAGLPVQFILCGDGARRAALKKLTAQWKLDNVLFSEFVNREGVKKILDESDAVWVCFKRHPILETGSPNKLFDGLAAGKLIILNFGGWVREEVEQANCGVFIDPDRPEEFVKSLSPFVSNRELLRKAQQAARKLAEEKYSRTGLSARFNSIFPNQANS